MAFPWLAALRMIPWRSLIASAPAIARAADALAAGARAPKPDAASITDVRRLADRVAALEARDRDHADLVKGLSDQVAALTAATAVLAARVRWLTWLAAAAAIAAAVGITVALL